MWSFSYFQDPKQKTLFSCFENLIEENDESLLLEAETMDPSSTCTTTDKPVDGSIDWFDDDSLLGDCMDDGASKGAKTRLTDNDEDTEPQAKRSKKR